MGKIDPALERLAKAVAELEEQVAARLAAGTAAEGRIRDLEAELAEVSRERDALRGAADAAGRRIDDSLATIRTLLDADAHHG